MPAKKPDLADVFAQNEEQYKPQETSEETSIPVEVTQVKRPPSRQKKLHIGIYVDEDVHTQLKIIGIEKKMTVQQMGVEALNAFFKLNDKPPIAK
ncbi:MAG: hypothetical protein OXI43_02790 [Candidatus Poribacteria bacterium]|nr:hypothetical protein [Candidatus Poribacteria bacterium]